MKYILLLLFISLVAGASAKKTGYLIVVTGSENFKSYKVENIERAKEIFDLYFDSECFDIVKVLKYSDYFQILTENKGVYIERKMITKRGRYRRIRDREKSKIKR